MALERPTARVDEWLTGPVQRVPSDGGEASGPVVSVEACLERKRSDATRIAVVVLEGSSSSDVAHAIVSACVNATVDVPARGVTFYLYAVNAHGRSVLAAFPVLVKSSDVDPATLATTAAGTSSSSSSTSTTSSSPATVASVVDAGAAVLLKQERAYSNELQRQNLESIAAVAAVIERAAKIHETAITITQQQSDGLLEQLRAANEARAAAETRARELEGALRDRDKALREALELAESLTSELERAQRELETSRNGPMAELKQRLLQNLADGAASEFFGANGVAGKPRGSA